MQKDKKLLFISLILALCLCFTLASCKEEDPEALRAEEYKDITFTFLDKNGTPVTKWISGGVGAYDFAWDIRPDENGKDVMQVGLERTARFCFNEDGTLYKEEVFITREIMDSGEYTVVFQGYTVTK
jgi:hypothetical protein